MCSSDLSMRSNCKAFSPLVIKGERPLVGGTISGLVVLGSIREQTEQARGSKQEINRYHIYIDQQHQLGKWQLNYGTEYQHSEDHSLQKYIASDNHGFDDTLHEDVASIYVGTQRSFGRSLFSLIKTERRQLPLTKRVSQSCFFRLKILLIAQLCIPPC